jgi:hypothetical protein
MMYTGKPLVTRTGAVQRRIDPRQAFIYGNLTRAQLVHNHDEESQGRAPSSWELVRRAPGGQTEVIANRVLAFDASDHGDVLYSDGAAIMHLDREGRSQRLLQAESIDRLLAL